LITYPLKDQNNSLIPISQNHEYYVLKDQREKLIMRMTKRITDKILSSSDDQ
jgi:hypothetical protein